MLGLQTKPAFQNFETRKQKAAERPHGHVAAGETPIQPDAATAGVQPAEPQEFAGQQVWQAQGAEGACHLALGAAQRECTRFEHRARGGHQEEVPETENPVKHKCCG